jgi:hypothetical protein
VAVVVEGWCWGLEYCCDGGDFEEHKHEDSLQSFAKVLYTILNFCNETHLMNADVNPIFRKDNAILLSKMLKTLQ